MNKITYKYENMPDKSKDGIRNEVSKGLGKIAFYFSQTYGMPIEIFKEIYEDKCDNGLKSLMFYMNFRNEHPEVFYE